VDRKKRGPDELVPLSAKAGEKAQSSDTLLEVRRSLAQPEKKERLRINSITVRMPSPRVWNICEKTSFLGVIRNQETNELREENSCCMSSA
jgi:hypothetical protein